MQSGRPEKKGSPKKNTLETKEERPIVTKFLDGSPLLETFILENFTPEIKEPITTNESPALHVDSDLSESKWMLMVPTPAPLFHRPLKDYESISDNLSGTFHKIYKLQKKNPRKRSVIYFFKQNKFYPLRSFMYELEETCNAFYRLIAPYHCPTSRALYNESYQYAGMISKTLPGFISTLDEPLREEDLQIDALNNMGTEIGIEELDAIDLRVRKENKNLSNIDNHVLCDVLLKSSLSNSCKKINITVKDLKNYRVVKGLAIGMTTSYIFEEDDMHTGNMSKDGKRIDFDWSLCTIFFPFRENGNIDLAFRNPEGRFKVSALDIIHFPNLLVASPFYWPTKPAPIIPEPIFKALSLIMNVSKNPFPSKDNIIYQKLETHPVFIYYKYVTLTKFILTQVGMYQNLMQLHMRDDIKFGSNNLVKIISDHIEERISIFKTELLKIPQFCEFIETKGNRIVKKILTEFSEYNETIYLKAQKQPLHELAIINLKSVIRSFCELCYQIGIHKNVIDLKNDPYINAILTTKKASSNPVNQPMKKS